MLTIIFFDINKELINEYEKIIDCDTIDLMFVVSDVETLMRQYKFDLIVSPANSFGSMKGGIDKIYKDIFPGIELTVSSTINKLKLAQSNIGYYIPVGRNIIVPTNHRVCKYLIVAPTMFTPRNIRKTNNIYLAFYGILKKYYNKNVVIACPGLGTGVGTMTPRESAIQIARAMNDYCNNN